MRSSRREIDDGQTFFVGLGAPKSGSTWLYDYLLTHPQCRMAVLKEMNYFNTVGSGCFARALEKIHDSREQARWLRESGARHINRYRLEQHRLLLDDYETLVITNEVDVPAYLEILRRHAGDARVFGEVSPGYSVLPTRTLRRIHEAFPRTRFVYLMRDPLQRLWSHARMIGRGWMGSDRQVVLGEVAAAILGHSSHLAALCSYADTIESLEAAAPRAHTHYEFFEVLFSGSAAATAARNRICDFLGIDRHCPEGVDKVVNGGVPMTLPRGLGRAALSWLRPHYDFVRARFGEIPPAWERSLAEFA